MSLEGKFRGDIQWNFLQVFGSVWGMDPKMRLEYSYADGISIAVSLRNDFQNLDSINIEFSKKLSEFLECVDNEKWKELMLGDSLQETISSVFNVETEVIYILAGRSMLTLLSNQLSYIYGSMDDVQKRALDYCTQNYLERILKIRGFFTSDTQTLIKEIMSLTNKKIDKELMQQAVRCISGYFKSA